MNLTKFTHSCVRLERDGRVLVLDPGNFSEVEEALRGAHAVLITHEHPDHIDRERVLPQLRDNGELQLYAPAGLAAELRAAAGESGGAGRIPEVEVNSSFTAAGFQVQSFGSQHALIHPLIPVVANLGYLIEGAVYHPGDSFTVPAGVHVPTLLVPIHAPYSKVAEVIDFVIACRAERAYPIHDSLLTPAGLDLVEGHVTRLGKLYGTAYRHLVPGDTVQL